MEKVKVSVIMPIFNRLRFVDSALHILKSQTLKDIEFIIVDDGSKDGSYEDLVKKTKSDKRFKIFKLDVNSGPSVARNFALTKVTGEYIGFFDADDSVPTDYFESLYNQAKETQSDIVFGTHNDIKHEKTGVFKELSDKISVLQNGALWDKLFSGDLILDNKISFPAGLYCADNVFVFKAFYYAKSIYCTNCPVYGYTLSSDSISSDTSKAKKRKKDILIVADKIMDFIQEKKFDDLAVMASNNFLNKSLNCYVEDSDFEQNFNKILLKSGQKGLYSYSIDFKEETEDMLWVRIKRFFGLVSAEKFDYLALIRRIRKSKLFNKHWYLKQYPDVKASGMNPLNHYLEYGWKEGRNPSAKFDNDAYWADIGHADMCPLVHFVTFGYKEGRLIHKVQKHSTKHIDTLMLQYKTLQHSKLFSKKYYYKHNADIKNAKMDPIKHYLEYGWKEGRNPSAKFDNNFYLKKYTGIADVNMNPLYHYIRWGRKEGRIRRTVSGKEILYRSLGQKIKYVWEWPLRVYDKYHRLKDEIRNLKNSK